MNDQWQELKETITEMRDNDGTGTQQEVCKFLANLMDILEKQMQELTPNDDYFRRMAGVVISQLRADRDRLEDELAMREQEPILDKIRAEIQAMSTDYCGGYIGLDKQEVLKIIDKYRKEER